MSRPSPTIEGFRAAFRRPSLSFAEITWRWTVGAVACTLFLFSFFEFLNTLRVSNGDAALLRTRQPLLVGRAMSHILRGSLNRAVFAMLLSALALCVLWIIAASIGRAATSRALLDYMRQRLGVDGSSDLHPQSISFRSFSFRSLIILNSLRIVTALAAILALAGAANLAGFASPDASPNPGLAFILFLPFAGLVCIVWPLLNWFLSLAGLLAVRDGEDAFGALSAAATFFREHIGSIFAVSLWTGLAHLVALSIAGTALSFPLAFIQIVPPRVVIVMVVLVALAYFAVVDWLYIARLAGYICIAKMPESLASSEILPTPQFDPSAPVQTAIDRDELILGDIPNLPAET